MRSSTTASIHSLQVWCVLCLLTMLASGARAAPVTTRSSDWIANSIGVNTHFDYHTYHSQDENFFQQILKPRLIESGIRHVRDSTGAVSDYTAIQRYARRLSELSAAGIDFILQTHPNLALADQGTEDPDPNAAQGLRQKLRAFVRGDITFGTKLIPKIPGLIGVMQPNEWDHIRSFDATCLVQGDWYTRLTACNPSWFDDLRSYMQALHAIMQDPELQGLTLYGPTLVHIESYQSIQFIPNGTMWDRMQALNQYFDVGAVNFYAWPGPHTSGFSYYLNPRTQYYGNKGYIISEMGNYNNSFGQVDIYGVSKQVQAIYLLRGLVEHLRRDPTSLQYIYELYDQGDAPPPNGAPTTKEGSFGLLENDGTPKLAYLGLKNLIALTSDKGQEFTPEALDLQLVSPSGNLHTLVTQKRDGRFIVLLWDENPIVSNGSYRTVPVRLTFNQEWDVNLYDPLASDTLPQSTWSEASSVDLDIPDSVVVLELVAPQQRVPPIMPTPTPTSTAVTTIPPAAPTPTDETPQTPVVETPSSPGASELCSLAVRAQGRAVTLRLLSPQITRKQRLYVSATIAERVLWRRAIKVSSKRVYKLTARVFKSGERAEVIFNAVRANQPDNMLCSARMR